MKKILIFLTIILAFGLLVGCAKETTASPTNGTTNKPAVEPVKAEELTGWIIDRDCLGKNVPTAHSKKCNLMGSTETPPTSCYASGLGIYTNITAPTAKTDLANYLVFDQESKDLTKAFLQNLPANWADNITVKVTGYRVNEIPTNLNETNVPETDTTKIDHYIPGFHVTTIEMTSIDGISTNAL